MLQSLELPVLLLAIPNIHKLNDINADNLSCMWTGMSHPVIQKVLFCLTHPLQCSQNAKITWRMVED
jgi:hypothetical protein